MKSLFNAFSLVTIIGSVVIMCSSLSTLNSVQVAHSQPAQKIMLAKK